MFKVKSRENQIFLGISLGVAVAALVYWLTRPVKKPQKLKIETDAEKISKKLIEQLEKDQKQNPQSPTSSQKQNLLNVLDLAQTKVKGKMRLIKPSYYSQRKKFFKVDDENYRKTIKEFSRLQQTSVDEALKEALKDLDFTTTQFKGWIQMFGSAEEVKKGLQKMTNALVFSSDLSLMQIQVTDLQIESLLDFQCKRMQELCIEEKPKIFLKTELLNNINSVVEESIAYISCFISDEMQELFGYTEEQIN